MFKKKLHGGALYIALIISMVTGIILSIFILIGFYNQKQVLSQIGLNQLENNLHSAFSIAQSQFFLESENNKWMALGPDNDSIRIKRLRWGAYSLISTETKNAHHYLKKCGIYGTMATSDTAILVCDQGRQVALSGKINFNGKCYFPKSGYKSVFIEGQSFNTSSPINSLMHEAPSLLPEIKDSFITEIENSISKFNPNADSLISELSDFLNNSFSAKTIVIQSENLQLQSHQLSGNIKIVCNNSVVIENSNSINNILVVASKIRIKKGFTGALHIIASDSIIIEEDCRLNYPSSLTVLNKQNKDNGNKGILIAAKSIIYGSIICVNAKKTMEADPPRMIIKLDSDCEIYGLIYSDGYAHLQGRIYGTAFCNKLFIKTGSAVYENHLMNCEIDPKKYAHCMIIPGIFTQKNIDKCGKWL
jgi:hypothetical protein